MKQDYFDDPPDISSHAMSRFVLFSIKHALISWLSNSITVILSCKKNRTKKTHKIRNIFKFFLYVGFRKSGSHLQHI